MATITYRIFKHHKKQDGTYNVKIAVCHKRQTKYIPSAHFVTDKQIRVKDMLIKDYAVIDMLNKEVAEYRGKVAQISAARLMAINVDDLVDIVMTPPEDVLNRIDFIAFSWKYIERLNAAGRRSTAITFRVVINNLIDYFGRDTVDISETDSIMLRKFDLYLRTERKQSRLNHDGTILRRTAKALGDAGVHNIMRDLRILFNECCREYNSERKMLIKHNPFNFYKVPRQPAPKKKGFDITLDHLIAIRDMNLRKGSRAELARDLFMLSFYMCGMNAKDIYDYAGPIDGDRIEYGRSKTKDRRQDGAIISVAIPDVARPILVKHSFKRLNRRYADSFGLLHAIQIGMKEIGELIGLPSITFYHARHLFATLAFNQCGFSKDEVGAALNHVEYSARVTDRYIAMDWSVIDRVQVGVLKLLD